MDQLFCRNANSLIIHAVCGSSRDIFAPFHKFSLSLMHFMSIKLHFHWYQVLRVGVVDFNRYTDSIFLRFASVWHLVFIFHTYSKCNGKMCKNKAVLWQIALWQQLESLKSVVVFWEHFISNPNMFSVDACFLICFKSTQNFCCIIIILCTAAGLFKYQKCRKHPVKAAIQSKSISVSTETMPATGNWNLKKLGN